LIKPAPTVSVPGSSCTAGRRADISKILARRAAISVGQPVWPARCYRPPRPPPPGPLKIAKGSSTG
jgi:hypothetical protein